MEKFTYVMQKVTYVTDNFGIVAHPATQPYKLVTNLNKPKHLQNKIASTTTQPLYGASHSVIPHSCSGSRVCLPHHYVVSLHLRLLLHELLAVELQAGREKRNGLGYRTAAAYYRTRLCSVNWGNSQRNIVPCSRTQR